MANGTPVAVVAGYCDECADVRSHTIHMRIASVEPGEGQTNVNIAAWTTCLECLTKTNIEYDNA